MSETVVIFMKVAVFRRVFRKVKIQCSGLLEYTFLGVMASSFLEIMKNIKNGVDDMRDPVWFTDSLQEKNEDLL